jgi:hypothetical protein
VRFADVARTLDAFNDRVSFGTLLSREQYLADIEQLGYLDARLQPHGSMTAAETRIWTDAIEQARQE